MTTKTKTNTDTHTSTISTVSERIAELSAANAHESDLLTRLGEGDDTISDESLALATASVRRAGLLLDAARKAEAQAKREHDKAEASADPELAEVVAELLSEHARKLDLHDRPLTIVDAVPSTAPDELPALYLVQDEPATPNLLTGTVSGSVSLVVLWADNPAYPMPLELSRRLFEVCLDAGVPLDVSNSGSGILPDGTFYRRITCTVRNYFPAVPVLGTSQPLPFRVTTLANALAQGVKHTAGPVYEAGISVWAKSELAFTVRADHGDPVIKTDKTTADGLVRHTITFPLAVWSRETTPEAAVGATKRVLEAEVGQAHTGLGRVESATVESVEPINGNGRELAVKMVLVHRLAR